MTYADNDGWNLASLLLPIGFRLYHIYFSRIDYMC